MKLQTTIIQLSVFCVFYSPIIAYLDIVVIMLTGNIMTVIVLLVVSSCLTIGIGSESESLLHSIIYNKLCNKLTFEYLIVLLLLLLLLFL